LHRRDVNSGKKNGVRASLLLQPTSDLTVRLTAFRQEIKADGTFAVDVDNNTLQPGFGPFTHGRETAAPDRYTYDHYDITANWHLGWANAFSSTTYGRNNNRDTEDQSLQPVPSLGVSISDALSAAVGVPVGLTVVNQAEVQKFTQELRLQSSSNTRLEWEVG